MIKVSHFDTKKAQNVDFKKLKSETKSKEIKEI